MVGGIRDNGGCRYRVDPDLKRKPASIQVLSRITTARVRRRGLLSIGHLGHVSEGYPLVFFNQFSDFRLPLEDAVLAGVSENPRCAYLRPRRTAATKDATQLAIFKLESLPAPLPSERPRDTILPRLLQAESRFSPCCTSLRDPRRLLVPDIPGWSLPSFLSTHCYPCILGNEPSR